MALPTTHSQIPESFPKNVNFEEFILQNEMEHPIWMSWRRFLNCLISLPENMMWNSALCVLTVMAIMILSMDFVCPEHMFGVPVNQVIDVAYNVIYGLYVVAHMLNDCYRYHHEHHNFSRKYWLWYVLDIATYLHYVAKFLPTIKFLGMTEMTYAVTMLCYYVRIRRTFAIVLNLNTYYLDGSCVGCLLKYWYIFLMVRIIASNAFVWLGLAKSIKYKHLPESLSNRRAKTFFQAAYITNKMFYRLGIENAPDSDLCRVANIILVMIGALLIGGISVAALALIIGVHMKSEYMFRARLSLITNDMKESHVPIELRRKVEAFYKVYWEKQKALSVTQLLPTYPPSLVSTLYIDIYFEALQKSRVLRDLSYQFLSEVVKYMHTINYVPGDVIIKRKSNKYAVVYISHGDVEVKELEIPSLKALVLKADPVKCMMIDVIDNVKMVTAEDDETPILRFTRGTILNPCGVCVDVACSKAHVTVKAATFCIAHVLRTVDLWRVAIKHAHLSGQTYIMHSAMEEHLDRVVRHYAQRPHPPVQYKTTIMQLKRNLIELKETRDKSGKLLMNRSDVFLQIADCYIMRNELDVTSLTHESDAICLRTTFPCILQPSSDLQNLWKVFVVFVTLAVTIVHPYYRVFTRTAPISFLFFNFMVTVIYILDIIVHLSTGAKVEEGVPVTFLHTSSRQMQSLWFILDVLAATPIFEFIGNGNFAGMNKLCKLFYVFHALKQFEDTWALYSSAIRFFSFCLLMVIVPWLVAALQHGIYCFGLNYCRVGSFLDIDVWEFNKTAKTASEMADLLLYSIFWAVSVSTFSDHPTAEACKFHYPTQAQIIFILEICAILQIFVKALYAAKIMVTKQLSDQYDACIDTVQRFLEKNDVDPVLRYRFINYLQLCWYTDKAYGITQHKRSIMFDLPHYVHQDISATQRNKYLLCIPFMKAIPEKNLKSICASAHLFYVAPDEILLNTGDISNEIYVIKQGFCEMLDPDTKQVVAVLTVKDHFGDIECLLRLPAYYTVRAITHVQVFTVSRKELMTAIATHKIRDAIIYAKSLPEYQSLVWNRRKQFVKYEMPAPPANRMKFRLPRKHEIDAAFLQPFQYLGSFYVLKYVFPRYTIRPDGQYLRRYEIFRGFCAFCSAMLIPNYYFLSMQFPWIPYLVFFLEFSAYFDVIQRMLVGYFNEQGVLVYHPVSTLAHYIRGAMIVDVLGCLPLENLDNIILYLFADKNYTIVPKAMEILLLNRCLQLYRLPGAMEFLDNYVSRRDILFGIKVMPLFIVVMSVVGNLITISSVTYISYDDGGWKLIPFSRRYTSWIIFNASNVGYNITKTPFNLWLTTHYWATGSLTSNFSTFVPNSRTLLVIFILGMLLASTLAMYFLVRLLSIRSNVNQALAEFQHNMNDMIVFMKREKVPKNLQREVRSYYEYTWEKTGGTDYRSVFKLCDHITLRTDAILQIYGETFRKCSILYKCDTSLLRLLGRAMHSVYFPRGMTVIQRHDVISQLYIIDYGTVLALNANDEYIISAILPRGSIFGNLNNVGRDVCPSTFVIDTNAHLLKIDALLFYKILQDFPLTRARLMEYRPNQENYIIGNQTTKERLQSSSSLIQTHQDRGIHYYCQYYNPIIIIYLSTVCRACLFLDIYNAGFRDNSIPLLCVLYFLDLAFIPKLATSIFFPNISEQKTFSKGVLKEARKRYLHDEFKYDILSLLPLELFSLCFPKPWRVFAYFRLNRLFRIVTAECSRNHYRKKLSADMTWTTIIVLVARFSLFIHSMTCFWYFLADYQDENNPKTSWRWSTSKNSSSVVSFRHNKEAGSNLCFQSQYICSMYFIIITIMQNGEDNDILPRQQIEVIFIMVLMLASMFMYMIYVAQFARIISYRSHRFFSFYGKYLELQEFLKNNRVSSNLVAHTKKYTLHLWRSARGLQSPRFVDKAPHCLRVKVMSSAYMKHLMGTPIFKHCEPAFLRHLVGYLQPFYYEEKMYVVREGEITNSMYFIHKGRVEELIEEIEQKSAVFNERTCFGSVHGLYRDVAYTRSYRTEIKSQVLTLSLDSWEYLLTHFPENKGYIYRNMRDPKFEDGYYTRKTTKVRTFPPKSMMTVEQELSKTFPKGESRLERLTDDELKKTQRLIMELKNKINALEISEKSESDLASDKSQSLESDVNKTTGFKKKLVLPPYTDDTKKDSRSAEPNKDTALSTRYSQAETSDEKTQSSQNKLQKIKQIVEKSNLNKEIRKQLSLKQRMFAAIRKCISSKKKSLVPFDEEPPSAAASTTKIADARNKSLASDTQVRTNKTVRMFPPNKESRRKTQDSSAQSLRKRKSFTGMADNNREQEIMRENTLRKQKLEEFKSKLKPTTSHVESKQNPVAAESLPKITEPFNEKTSLESPASKLMHKNESPVNIQDQNKESDITSALDTSRKNKLEESKSEQQPTTSHVKGADSPALAVNLTKNDTLQSAEAPAALESGKAAANLADITTKTQSEEKTVLMNKEIIDIPKSEPPVNVSDKVQTFKSDSVHEFPKRDFYSEDNWRKTKSLEENKDTRIKSAVEEKTSPEVKSTTIDQPTTSYKEPAKPEKSTNSTPKEQDITSLQSLHNRTQSSERLPEKSDNASVELLPMSAFQRRKSTVFGIDKDAISKELSSVSSPYSSMSSASPKKTQKTKSSTEEVELATIFYKDTSLEERASKGSKESSKASTTSSDKKFVRKEPIQMQGETSKLEPQGTLHYPQKPESTRTNKMVESSSEKTQISDKKRTKRSLSVSSFQTLAEEEEDNTKQKRVKKSDSEGGNAGKQKEKKEPQ